MLAASPATAQDVRLRFDPPDGLAFQRLFQIHTRVVVENGGTRTRELVELGGVREVAVRGRENAVAVHLNYDSIRTRVREGAGAWREQPEPDDSAWVQARFDARLRSTVVASGGTRAGAERMLDLVTGFPRLELPARAVRAGDAWRSPVAVRVPAVEGEAAADVVLMADVAVHVDSVITREQDTLAYLSVAGVLVPETRGVAVYGGGVRGALVWSTGWQAFVSGAARTRIEVRVLAAENGREESSVIMETTVRQQVRPPS